MADAGTKMSRTRGMKNHTKAEEAGVLLRFYDPATGKTVPEIEPAFLDLNANLHPLEIIGNPCKTADGYVQYVVRVTKHTLATMGLSSPECYEFTWKNMAFPLMPGEDLCCSMEIPVQRTQCAGEIAEFELELNYAVDQPASDVAVSVEAVQSPYGAGGVPVAGFSQTKKTSSKGRVHFCLDAGHWYQLVVHAKGVQPCNPRHFFTCGGQKIVLCATCKLTDERCVNLKFVNSCGERVSARFAIDGKEYCAASGEYTLLDTKPGTYQVTSAGPAQFVPREIVIGTASEQTIEVEVEPVKTYVISIEVDNYSKSEGQAQVNLLHPVTQLLLQAAEVDHHGKAVMHVPDPGPYTAVLKLNGETIQTESIVATPLI